MTDEIPSQRLYAGGQECPCCERAVPVSHRYCHHCGEFLNAEDW